MNCNTIVTSKAYWHTFPSSALFPSFLLYSHVNVSFPFLPIPFHSLSSLSLFCNYIYALISPLSLPLPTFSSLPLYIYDSIPLPSLSSPHSLDIFPHFSPSSSPYFPLFIVHFFQMVIFGDLNPKAGYQLHVKIVKSMIQI